VSARSITRFTLMLHIGINTGPVLQGFGARNAKSYSVLAIRLNTAQRLQSLPAPATVWGR